MSDSQSPFDPLDYRPQDPSELSAHARNIVKNVLDSYTGRFDVLAEAVQNAMDAVEARWGDGLDEAEGRLDGEVPTIRIVIDASDAFNSITVTDNGVGIPVGKLKEVFTPHLSPKLAYERPTRGHKGVGTTFLIYGHPSFAVQTRVAGGERVSFKLDGGLAWVRDPAVHVTPRFMPDADAQDVLGQFGSGTSITVEVDDSTRIRRLKGAQYNKLATWELVLRTYTSLGYIAIGTPRHKLPEWVRRLRVELTLKGVPGGGTQTFEPGFRFPHADVDRAVSLAQIWSNSVPKSARYEMLYVELGSDELEKTLKSQIDELENSGERQDLEIVELLRAYDTEIYASWSYKNTLYEDIYRTAIDEPGAQRFQYMNVRNGLMVASLGMPVGETTDHPYSTMKPEYRRRLFMIASFNEKYSPDLGRKTIPAQARSFLEWLERQVQNLFLTHVDRLIKSNDEAPHKAADYAQAKEQIGEEERALRGRADKLEPLGSGLGFAREPAYEAEVVGLFYALLAKGELQGYSLVSVPGSRTRLDGYFDFAVEHFQKPDPGGELVLGISQSRAINGSFKRSGKWLEFKVRLEDLVEEFEADDASPGKKYFDLVDLAVVWDAPNRDAINDFDLVKLDGSNWEQRDYFGVTHMLKRGVGDHVVQVISLRSLLSHVQP